MISQPSKANVLLVGSGGVGTMGAYALETGGQAEVTAILRSNYEAVQRQGFSIDSIEHGNGIEGWKPTTSAYDSAWARIPLSNFGWKY